MRLSCGKKKMIGEEADKWRKREKRLLMSSVRKRRVEKQKEI
jgi:hypothetical protein